MSDERNTREKILDAAIELFTEQGFDATSLREIAERLSITKAALYYHFPSKADILGTLMDRLSEQIFDAPVADELVAEGRRPQEWAKVLSGMIDRLLDNAQLFAVFERNHAAVEQIAAQDDQRFQKHEENQARLQALMSDPSIPVETRVRYAAAIGAVFFATTHALSVFTDVDTEDLRVLLHRVVADIVLSPGAPL